MNELVTIRIDGDVAEGVFLCRSANAIEIEIVYPYRGFSMTFELVSFDRAQGPLGLLGDEGMRSARYLLKVLYRLCRHLADHDKQLVSAYEEYRQLHHEIVNGNDKISDHFLAMVIDDLRSKLSDGQIDRAQYDREVTAIRTGHSRLHEQLYHLRTEFFRMHFSKVAGHSSLAVESAFESALGRSLEQQVLVYLRRRVIDPERARLRRIDRD